MLENSQSTYIKSISISSSNSSKLLKTHVRANLFNLLFLRNRALSFWGKSNFASYLFFSKHNYISVEKKWIFFYCTLVEKSLYLKKIPSWAFAPFFSTKQYIKGIYFKVQNTTIVLILGFELSLQKQLNLLFT